MNMNQVREEAQRLLNAYFSGVTEESLSESRKSLRSSLNALIKATEDVLTIGVIGDEAKYTELGKNAVRYLGQIERQLEGDEQDVVPAEISTLTSHITHLRNQASIYSLPIASRRAEVDQLIQENFPAERSLSEHQGKLKSSLELVRDMFVTLDYLKKADPSAFENLAEQTVGHLTQIKGLLKKPTLESDEVDGLLSALYPLHTQVTAATVALGKRQQREEVAQKRRLADLQALRKQERQANQLREKTHLQGPSARASATLEGLVEGDESLAEEALGRHGLAVGSDNGTSAMAESSTPAPVSQEELIESQEGLEVALGHRLKVAASDWQSTVSAVDNLQRQIKEAYALYERLVDQEARYERAQNGNTPRLLQINRLWDNAYERTEERKISLDGIKRITLVKAFNAARKGEIVDDQRELLTLLQPHLEYMEKILQAHLEYLQAIGKDTATINDLLIQVSEDLLNLNDRKKELEPQRGGPSRLLRRSTRVIEGLPTQTKRPAPPGIDGLPSTSQSVLAPTLNTTRRILRPKSTLKNVDVDSESSISAPVSSAPIESSLAGEQRELERLLNLEPEAAGSDLHATLAASKNLRETTLQQYRRVETQLMREYRPKESTTSESRLQEYDARMNEAYFATHEKMIDLYFQDQRELHKVLNQPNAEDNKENQRQILTLTQDNLAEMKTLVEIYSGGLRQYAPEEKDRIRRMDLLSQKINEDQRDLQGKESDVDMQGVASSMAVASDTRSIEREPRKTRRALEPLPRNTKLRIKPEKLARARPSGPVGPSSRTGLGGWDRMERSSSDRSSDFDLDLATYNRIVESRRQDERVSQFINAIEAKAPGFRQWLIAAQANHHRPTDILDLLNEVVKARNTPVVIPERNLAQRIRGYVSRATDEFRGAVNRSINDRYSLMALRFKNNKLRDHTDGVLRLEAQDYIYIQPVDRNKSAAPLMNQARRINTNGVPTRPLPNPTRSTSVSNQPRNRQNPINPDMRDYANTDGFRGRFNRLDQKMAGASKKRRFDRISSEQNDRRMVVHVDVAVGDEVNLVKGVQHRGYEVDVLIKKATLGALMARADELDQLITGDRHSREEDPPSKRTRITREVPQVPSQGRSTGFPWFPRFASGSSDTGTKKRAAGKKKAEIQDLPAEADRKRDVELLAEQHNRLAAASDNLRALSTTRHLQADTATTMLLIGKNSAFGNALESLSSGMQDLNNRYPDAAISNITLLQNQVRKILAMTVAGHNVGEWVNGTASVADDVPSEATKAELKLVEGELQKLVVQVDAARAVIGRKQYENVEPSAPPVYSLTETAYKHFEEPAEGRVEQSTLVKYAGRLGGTLEPLTRWLDGANARTNAVELVQARNWPEIKKLGIRNLTTMGEAFNGLDNNDRVGVALEKMPMEVQRAHDLWKQLLVLDIGGAELKAWGNNTVYDTQATVEKWQHTLTDISEGNLISMLTACQKNNPSDTLAPDAENVRAELKRIFLAVIPRPRNVAGKKKVAVVGEASLMHPLQIEAQFGRQAEANLDRFLASVGTDGEAARAQLTAIVQMASLDANRAAGHLKRIFDEVMPEFAKVINRNVALVGTNATELDAQYYGRPDLDKVERVITQIRHQAHTATDVKSASYSELSGVALHGGAAKDAFNFSELEQILEETAQSKPGPSAATETVAITAARKQLGDATIGGVSVADWCRQKIWQKGELLTDCKALLAHPATNLDEMLSGFSQLLNPATANNPLHAIVESQRQINRSQSQEEKPFTLIDALQLALHPGYSLFEKDSQEQQTLEQYQRTYQAIAKVFNNNQLKEFLSQTAKSPNEGKQALARMVAATPTLEQFAGCWQAIFDKALPELRKVSGTIDHRKVEDAIITVKNMEKAAVLSSLNLSQEARGAIDSSRAAWGGYWDEKRSLIGATEIVPYAEGRPGALFKHRNLFIYVTKTQIDNYLGPLGAVTHGSATHGTTKSKAIQSMKPAWNEKHAQLTTQRSSQSIGTSFR